MVVYDKGYVRHIMIKLKLYGDLYASKNYCFYAKYIINATLHDSVMQALP